MKKMPFLALALAMALNHAAYSADNSTTRDPSPKPPTKTFPEEADSMKIRLKVGDTVLTATLIDSATTRDFISLLPLTLTLEDHAGTEKISDLPKGLSTEGAPSGSDPSIGDITYYAPWGNLAIFYRDSAGWMDQVSDYRNRRIPCAKEVDRS